MRKAVFKGAILLLLLLQGGCGQRVGEASNRASNEPIREKGGSELSSLSEPPPQKQLKAKKEESYYRLWEHKRLAELLSSAYKAKSKYVRDGACASYRDKIGTLGFCDEVKPDEIVIETTEHELDSHDKEFEQLAAQDAAVWSEVAKSDRKKMDAKCQNPRGRCYMGEEFRYWQKDENGEIINEDVEMLDLASLATAERITVYILMNVSSDLFPAASNNDDWMKNHKFSLPIERALSLTATSKSLDRDDSIFLSEQAIRRREELTKMGLGYLEAIDPRLAP
jgi:hypothetical protein